MSEKWVEKGTKLLEIYETVSVFVDALHHGLELGLTAPHPQGLHDLSELRLGDVPTFVLREGGVEKQQAKGRVSL